MPNKLIRQKKVDIYKLPEVQEASQRGEITIGDLHGNAIKLLFILIRHGIATNISKEDYQTLVDIYKTSLDDDEKLLPQSKSLEIPQEEIEDEISMSHRPSFYDDEEEEIPPLYCSVEDHWSQEDQRRALGRAKQEKLKCLFKTFNSIIDNLTVHRHLTVRLLGDELADRGNNDYFTLKILEKLAKSRVSVEIILSNHGAEFIEAYETYDEKFLPRTMRGDHNKRFTQSLQNMQRFIDWQLISSEEIMNLINSVYKPMLKAISYSLDEKNKEITLYSHAAIDLKVVKQLANKLGVKYEEETCQALAKTIDRINEEYQKFVTKGQVHRLCRHENMTQGFKGAKLSYDTACFEFIMWNRDYKSLQRPNKYFDYNICFVHGHDSRDPEKDKDHIFDLDDRLGINVDCNQGEYTALHTENGNVPRSESLLRRGWNFFWNLNWNTQEEPVPQASSQSNYSVKKVN